MKKNFLFMALLCLVFKQTAVAQVRELTVGDKFPDIEFNNLIRYSKSKLRISDFKGKLVILDFWSTGCGSCIAEMPEMGRLQKYFGNKIRILPINSIQPKSSSEEWVKTFKRWPKAMDSAWNTNPNLYKASSLPTILDTALYHYVKHLPGVSVKIWIDKEGIIRGITGPDYVNEKEIKNMLEGKFPKWRIFKKVEYDYEQPLVRIDSNSNPLPKQFYSIGSTHKDYVSSRDIYDVDTVKGTKRYLGINLSITGLYGKCYRKTGSVTPYESNVFVETSDSSRFFRMGRYYEEWWAGESYCFEKVAPINMPDSIFFLSMKQELDNQFGIQSRIENRKVNCLLLKAIGTEIRNNDKSSVGSLKQLIHDLNVNVLSGKKLIIADETLLAENGRKFNYPELSDYYDHMDLNKVNAALRVMGLSLEEAKRVVPVIVLKDLKSK
ncbi:thiol-disulfide isomerase/thioredoxin [Pedobacter africanus]|uniref:Thiol-disulfide isomerase/thioredoxin n=1 Tax=Pedobacter africanus TaxID=151894 RepID=A0ACC6L0Y0_9SPHI|nr:redoxin domain-containing protein [Pedobacter africanus]MDR6785259.1 thiol-disulfide isomerase/thioredoxin [Pedobacter africanus]